MPTIVSIEFGGTGSNTAAGALSALGAAPAVAYDQANSAYGQANAAYNAANNAANNAQITVFQNSNSSITTQNLNFINTSTITVEVSNNGGNANIALTAVGGAAFDQANAAYAQANTARDTANGAYSQANTARGTANDSYGAANTANTNALNAYAQANAAYDQANNARSDANTTFSTINSTFGTINTNYQAAYSQANTARDTANSAYNEANLKLALTGGAIVGDISITGNLFVNGVQTIVNTASLTVNDPIFLLANNNTTNAVGLGFVAHYGDTQKHTGLIRAHQDNNWYLFDEYDDHILYANNVLDTGNVKLATLRANVNANSLLLLGNTVATQANLTLAHNQANAAYGAANNRVLKAGDTMTGQLNISSGGLIVTGGDVGIGTTNPSTTLFVNGSLSAGPSGNSIHVTADTDSLVRIGQNIINGGVGTSRLNIQDRLTNFISFFVSSSETASISNGGTGYTSDLSFKVNGSDRLRIASNGNVGIGTTIPSINLQVAGTNNNAVGSSTFWNFNFTGQEITNLSNTAGSVSGLALIGGSGRNAVAAIAGVLETTALSSLAFFTGGQGVGGGTVPERMRITSGGNVGIGTTNPDQRLTVQSIMSFKDGSGTTRGLVGCPSWDTSYISFQNNTRAETAANSAINQSPGGQTIINSAIDTNMAFRINNATQGSILSTGEYVIGDTDTSTISSDRLHSLGQIGGRSSLSAGAYARLVMQERTSNWISFVNGSGTHYGTISLSGSGVSYGSNSDYRLKENIIDLTNAIDRVKNLKPKRFNFINKPEITQDGFLAHEVQTVVPESVVGKKDEYIEMGDVLDSAGNLIKLNVEKPKELEEGTTWVKKKEDPKYQTLDTSYLVPLLTKALQEAIEKIENLEAEVAALKNK